ncbi:MAG: HAD family hydrolase [Bacteroidales bacterium]|nr:HAD family hydrolase [Bacteroidales bacterium]
MINSYVFVFDLDDTLYKEIDFLKSGYRSIASLVDKNHSWLLYQRMLNLYYEGENVFDIISKSYKNFPVDSLLNIYRNHFPDIQLEKDVLETLQFLKKKGKTGLVTDGRSSTQRNKLQALGIEDYFDKIVISEETGYAKPDIRLFQQFHEFKSDIYYYIANDTSKDFITPNQLGWTTVCLLDSKKNNIIEQNFTLKKEYLPLKKIKKISEIKKII